ncbi:MAG: hypothetical protein A2729_00505 [Candidatus Buchananbacteria bacterium RIFCSPHIGHO2_01_FULL_39_14]|uniref:Uncharacterized protein n=2 Tax=Candidatus Buchananiibacteriota TaxID=1817903 RepID=A0A1G1YMA7_9BACT|nr:MAG: hypothetical protein A2729_00505 [Candidatus Buchananbacteria bacterium RIFCSPHIGHO2_01_FULL_39_14]OGY48721.1 MAG: hypothetical protein A3D39_04600 [Candidatus Buchananbacteria bacterium RIFCSPHIGHO2_02_FULL_39_17]OGY53492.1 MAG: hypothetical protein A2912_05910 [Candidatus Buchananbacteria bacterium RIFCSPLOWO2_01_FULL_40_23b]
MKAIIQRMWQSLVSKPNPEWLKLRAAFLLILLIAVFMVAFYGHSGRIRILENELQITNGQIKGLIENLVTSLVAEKKRGK